MAGQVYIAQNVALWAKDEDGIFRYVGTLTPLDLYQHPDGTVSLLPGGADASTLQTEMRESHG